MTDDKQAILNGIATATMQEMLRKGELFKLPSSLSHFIANKGWESVEYIEPESGAKRVAHFDLFTDWVTASPARAGLGTRLDQLVKLVSQPLDADAAPECCHQLMNVLDDLDKAEIAPLITKAAAANAKLTGNDSWNEVLSAADEAVQQPHGKHRDVDNVHITERPAGNSAAAGLRKLRRYATSESLCEERGLDQSNVTEQYGKTLRGEKSVHRALIDAGLKKKEVKSLWIGSPAVMAQRILDGLGRDKAAELITELSALLTK
jgi:hypothetical protein